MTCKIELFILLSQFYLSLYDQAFIKKERDFDVIFK